MAHVFISYAREDQDFAEVVQAKLERAGHTTSLDTDLLRAGDDWGDKLDAAIRAAHVLALVMTPAARASTYVAYEWAFALGAGVRLIVIDLLETEHHPRLAVLQRLDFRDKARPWDTLLAEVVRAETAREVEGDADPSLPSAVRQATRALDSLDVTERRKGVLTLASAEGEAAKEALTKALAHPLKDVRIEAARLFPERGDPRLVAPLFEGVELTGDSETLWSFYREVTAMGPAAVPTLLSLWSKHGGASEESLRLLRLLGLAKDPRALPVVETALGDGSPDVRMEAASALAQLGGDAASAALRGALRDPVTTVRVAVVEALGMLGDRAAAPALTELLLSDVSAVRLAAAAALGRLADPATVPALRCALADSNSDVGFVAAAALARLGEASGVEALMVELGVNGEINDRQARAMAVLAELAVPEALPRIEQCLVAFRRGSIPVAAIKALRGGVAGVGVLCRVLGAAQPGSSIGREIAEVLADALANLDAPEVHVALRAWRLRN